MSRPALRNLFVDVDAYSSLCLILVAKCRGGWSTPINIILPTLKIFFYCLFHIVRAYITLIYEYTHGQNARKNLNTDILQAIVVLALCAL